MFLNEIEETDLYSERKKIDVNQLFIDALQRNQEMNKRDKGFFKENEDIFRENDNFINENKKISRFGSDIEENKCRNILVNSKSLNAYESSDDELTEENSLKKIFEVEESKERRADEPSQKNNSEKSDSLLVNSDSESISKEEIFEDTQEDSSEKYESPLMQPKNEEKMMNYEENKMQDDIIVQEEIAIQEDNKTHEEENIAQEEKRIQENNKKIAENKAKNEEMLNIIKEYERPDILHHFLKLPEIQEKYICKEQETLSEICMKHLEDESIYIGTFNKDNQPHGLGKRFYPDGSIYNGF